MAPEDPAEEEVLVETGTGYGRSMDAGSRTDSFDALLVELVGELDATHPALSDLGRFEVTAILGEGGFGSVYAATDTRDGRQVALKVLRRGSADALLRFKREFRSLADVRHLNLVRLHELLQVGEKWLLSMERVAGQPWDAYVAHHPERLQSTLAQLVEGVAALHAAGKLHRDLKPSNVLVEDGGRVVILDFGLVRERGTEGSTVLAGTPVYMSPEQCAERDLGPASDWYAVGVMLYQALSGRVPFEGSLVELLRAKQEREAPPLEVDREGEGELAELAMRLLARDPKARPSGEVLRRALSSEDEAPATSRGALSQDSESRELFVGREAELSQLHAALAHVKTSGPHSVYVHGLSGMGKSALVARFAEQARAEGALVLTGRCYERETVPFKAVDGLVDSLCLHLRKLGRAQAAALLPRGIHAAAKLFPVLNAVDASADVPKQRELDDGPEQRRRGFVALKELLGALADGRPLVVVIDDLQWGDEDSARLLAELLGPPGNPSMLFVGAFRREERDDSVLLRELGRTFDADEELGVDALSEEAATRMAAMLLGKCDSTLTHLEGQLNALDTSAAQSNSDSASRSDSQSSSDSPSESESDSPSESESASPWALGSPLGRKLARESEGHPLFLRQLVQHAAERGTDGPAPSLGNVLRARLAALSAEERGVLELLAIAGRPTPRRVVDAATTDAAAPLSEVLAALASDAWVRTTSQESALECFHDRVREVAVGQLTPARRRALHRVLADALVATSGPADAIAESYLAAGAAEATDHAVRAAEEAAGKLAFEQAMRWYREALRLAPSHPEARGWRPALAEATSAAGRGAEAGALFLEAAAQTTGLDALTLRKRAANAYLGAGHWQEGLAALSPLLAELGRPIPATTAGIITRLGVDTLQLWRADHGETTHREVELTAELCFEAMMDGSYALATSDMLRCAYLATDAAKLALEHGSRTMLLEGLALHTAILRPASDAAKARCRRARDEAANDILGSRRVRRRCVAGVLELARGNWHAFCATAERTLDELRDEAPDAHGLFDFLTQSHAYAVQRQGAHRVLADIEENRMRRALTLGRPFPLSMARIFRSVLALARGDVTRAQTECEQVDASLDGTRLFRAALRKLIALYIEDRGAAARAVGDMNRQRAQMEVYALLYADFGAYEPRVDLAFWRGDGATLRKVERRARRIGKKPIAFAQAVETGLLAGVAARRKRFAKAAELFGEAARKFDQNHMKLDAAACRLRQGEIVGGERGRALVTEAEAVLREEDVADPERFAHAVYAPRFPLR